MIIKFSNLDNFLLDELNKKYFLFYGPNIGRVGECLAKIIKCLKSNYKLNVINLHSEELKKGRLIELFSEFQTPNIFGDHTLISLFLSDEKLSKEIINYLSKQNTYNISIVIRSGQLSKKSILRSFFEKDLKSIIIPCYEETYNEKTLLIKEFFEKEKVFFQSDQLKILSDRLSNDRIEIKNELEKVLVLLNDKSKEQPNMNIADLVTDSLEIDNIKFVNDIINGDSHSFFAKYKKFTDFGNDNIKLISYLLDHLYKLSFVKGKLREGKDIKKSMSELKPQIFFKYQDSFVNQIRKFEETDLKIMIRKLIACKKNFIENKSSSNYEFLYTMLIFFNSRDLSKNS